MKRTLLAMTALSGLVLISPALHDTAMAGQYNKPSIRPSIRIIRPPVKMRIDTKRLVTKAAKKPAGNGAAEAGPQPEPPTRPTTAEVARAAIPPLPRPRPFDVVAESSIGPDIGPDTSRPQAGLTPGIWDAENLETDEPGEPGEPLHSPSDIGSGDGPDLNLEALTEIGADGLSVSSQREANERQLEKLHAEMASADAEQQQDDAKQFIDENREMIEKALQILMDNAEMATQAVGRLAQ